MSLKAKIDAAVNAAIIDANKFQEVTFNITVQKAGTTYDTTTGVVTNANPIIGSKILIPRGSQTESDGESVKVQMVTGIILRSWYTGDFEIDDIVTINTGEYAGTYVVSGEIKSSVAHWKLTLNQ